MSEVLRGLLATVAVVCLAGGPLSAQQTLFERALVLDSLYDRIRAGEEQLADAFFTELRGMYPGGAGLTDQAIYEDIVSTNEYLRPKLNLVYSKLEDVRSVHLQTADRLQRRIDSTYAAAIRIATAKCRAQSSVLVLREACSYGVYIDLLEEYPSPLQLAALRKEIARADPTLARRVRQLENEVYEIAADLDSEQLRTESVVQLDAAAGGGLPFDGGSGVSDQAFSPLVIQPAAPASLQSSVIDGASRWIAERMREELSIAFFDRFESWMEDQRMYALFPNTFNALAASVTTDYALMIQIMKTAFQKDLNALPFSVGDYLRFELQDQPTLVAARQRALDAYLVAARNEAETYVPDPETGIKRYNFEKLLAQDSLDEAVLLRRAEVRRTGEVINYVLFGIAAIEQLSQGRHPSNLLSVLSERVDDFFPDAGELRPALLLLDVLSRSLIKADPAAGTVWVDRRELLGLARDAQLREIYFGLIHQGVRQELRSRRQAIERERADILARSGGAEERADERYADRYMMEMLLGMLQLPLLKNAQEDPQTAVFRTLREGYNPDVWETPMTVIESYFERYREGMLANERLVNFDYARLTALDEERQRALTAFSEEITAIYDEFALGDPEEPLFSLTTSLKPFEYHEGGSSLRAYRSYEEHLVENLKLQISWLTGNADAIVRMEAAIYPLLDPYVAYYNYLGEVIPLIDPIRQQVLAAYEEEIEADSVAWLTAMGDSLVELRELNYRLYQLDEDQKFLDDVLLDKQERFGHILNEFSLFAEQIDQVQAQYKSLREAGSANLGHPQMIHLMRNSLGVVRQLFDLALPGQTGKLDTIQFLTSSVMDAYAAVLEQDYDAVVMNVIPIATTLLDVEMQDRRARLTGSSAELLDDLAADQTVRQRKLQEVFRYGAFLAAVVESETADDIKRAIGSIALPSGSYSIKRRNFGNISLNANPGLTGGMEMLNGAGENFWAPNFGFTAPVGLAFSWGYAARVNEVKYTTNGRYRRRVDRSLPMRGNRFLTGHSGSLFFPLLDLGAVVLFRLDGNTESLPEDVGFQQVFSPGVQYAHGFPNLPIALMVGGQVSPRLRKFGEERLDAFRFNLGITVDLPMVNFHTRSVEKQQRPE